MTKPKLKLTEKTENIVDFKTRQEQFHSWVEKCVEANCTEHTIEHAVLIMARKDKNGKEVLDAARFNSTVKEFEEFSTFLQDCILYSKLDDYLRNNIGDYLQYVE